MTALKTGFGLLTGLALAALLVWIQFKHLNGVAPWGDTIHFHLQDQRGKPVSEADFAGKTLLLYFGYTYCPDVCPTTLSMVAEALDHLGPDAASVIPIMITIDPDRDTPNVLADYMEAFGKRFVGLSGSPAEIAEIARQFGAVYSRAGEGADYTMDHSASLYLIDPDGRPLVALPHGTTAEVLVETLRNRSFR